MLLAGGAPDPTEERSKNKLKTIAVINQKGGVGKSTTAAAVGAGLILKGYRVLFIDLDAQGNISHTLRATPNSSGIMAMLQEPEIVRQTIEELPTAAITGSKERKGAAAVYGVIASSNKLAAADTLLDSVGKEYRLKEALELIEPLYDYAIIDTPPALGILTVNALTAATAAIVPAQADQQHGKHDKEILQPRACNTGHSINQIQQPGDHKQRTCRAD